MTSHYPYMYFFHFFDIKSFLQHHVLIPIHLGSPKISPHGFPKCSKCFKSNLSIEKLSNKKVSNMAWVLLYYCAWLIFNSNVMQHVTPMTSYLVNLKYTCFKSVSSYYCWFYKIYLIRLCCTYIVICA
jgi:hypothetical protein